MGELSRNSLRFVAKDSPTESMVNDPQGIEVARSEELSSERNDWTVSKPLKRGESYAWTVVVDGKEIVSPGLSSPEVN